jgi:sugar porter (SP) family MFS transporter
MLAPLYIAEIAPATIRGRLVGLNQLAIMVGILTSYLVGWGLSFLGDGSWRWMFACGAIPSFLFLAALFGVPESLRWLIKGGRENDARRVLVGLGAPETEVETIKIALQDEGEARLLQPSLRRPLMIGVILAVFQQITGINTILYYGSLVFSDQFRSASTSAALWANVTIGAVNLVLTVVALIVIDKLGRRVLLMVASGGMGLSLSILALMSSAGALSRSGALILILCYVGFFSFGLGPGVWVVIAELFPTRVRGRAMSVATICLWISCLLITSSFLSLVRAISIQGAFGLYAALCACTFVFVLLWVPETKGKSLELIERQWLLSE